MSKDNKGGVISTLLDSTLLVDDTELLTMSKREIEEGRESDDPLVYYS